MMPIHVASEKGQAACVEYLIKKRVDLDAGDMFRVTAMHLAAIDNHPDVLRLLINARANVKPQDTEGDQPMHWAATKGHVECMELLRKAGAPVECMNSSAWTPLHRAAYNGRKAACVALVNAGASLTARNKDGNTPLHLACFMNQLSTIEALLGLASRTDIKNVEGKLPLELCITDAAREMITGHQQIAKFPAHAKPQRNAEEEAKARAAAAAAEAEEQAVARAKDAGLTAGLRQKVVKGEEFPDMDSPRAVSPAHSDEGRLFVGGQGGGALGLVGSEFLSEAAQVMDDSRNPYAMGFGRGSSRSSGDGGEVERTSAASGWDRASVGSGRPSNRPSVAGSTRSPAPRPSQPARDGDAARRAALNDAGPDRERSSAGSARALRQQGNGGKAGAWEGGARPSADQYQQQVRDENRRVAASAAGSALLGPPASGLTGAEAAPRPQSGNKKFLSKYNLQNKGLFAP